MIHKTQQQWLKAEYQHSAKSQLLILDFSLFSQLKPFFEELSAKVNIPADVLARRYEEIVLDTKGLKEYLNVVILRLESFKEKFEKQNLRGLSKIQNKCSFDLLANAYLGIINIGVDIPIQKGSEFPGDYLTSDQMKKIKIFSVRVGIEDKQKIEFLKKIKINFPIQIIHINLSIKAPQDLILFQRFLIDNQYPIENIILTTNQLSVFAPPLFSKDQTLTLQSLPSKVAYHHVRTQQRYLNNAFTNLCEYFTIPYQKAISWGDSQKDIQLDKYLKLFLQIQKRKNKVDGYKGGFIIPPTLMLPSLKHFTGLYDNDQILTTYVQRYAMNSINLAMSGDFKTMKSAFSSSQ